MKYIIMKSNHLGSSWRVRVTAVIFSVSTDHKDMAAMMYQHLNKDKPQAISAGFVDFSGGDIFVRGQSEYLKLESKGFDALIIKMANNGRLLYSLDELKEHYDL